MTDDTTTKAKPPHLRRISGCGVPKRIGRPTQSRDGGVQHNKTMRYSDAEWAWMAAQAAAADLTQADWMRNRCLRGMPRRRD